MIEAGPSVAKAGPRRLSAAEQYVDDVLSGRQVACRWVRLACERHRRDLEHGHERGLWFDEMAAKVAISFFSVLRHWKGEWAGKPVSLEPAQQFWIWSLFGWKRADGSRRFRTAYLEVARKNGKTTLAAGVGLYLAFVDGEPGAEVYSAATMRDQARISHRDATRMVKSSPQLRQLIGVFRDNLHEVKSGSKFEPLSADYNSLDGLNVHGVIADELHAWPQPELWGVLKTGTGSRRQPLMLAITTAGVDQQGVCYRQREYITRILKGILDDDGYWGMIYTIDTKQDWSDLDQDDDWQDKANWVKANPNLGVSKKWYTMRADAREAAHKPAELNQFLRWHLNVWTQALTRWVNPIHWAACGQRPVDPEELAGRACYGGLDLSQIYDITALVLVFPPEDADEPYQALCRFWLPADNMLERVRKDQVPYEVWVRQGFLKLTPGNVVDYDFILAEIGELAEQFDLREIGYDRYGATLVSQQLQEMGGEEWVVPIGQGFLSMSPPLKELGKLIASEKLAHGGNPVLTWMADNLVAVEDAAGNIKPDKARSREKIDGMVALVMALDRATRHAEQGSPGILIL
jgi:phage terminase large subunit-like protein